MRKGERIGALLGVSNAALTATFGLCIGLAMLIGRQPKWMQVGLGDVMVFILVWAYLTATPILALVVFALGPRSSVAVRLNIALFLLWVAVGLLSLTVTF